MHPRHAALSTSCRGAMLRRACLAAALLAWPTLAHAAAPPAASLQPSKALGVVGQEVELAISLSGVSPEPLAGARVVIEHVRPDGEVVALGGEAGATGDGLTVRQAFVPAVSGFHRFRARVSREGAEEVIVDAGKLPVLVEDLSIMFWNGPRTLENLNWRLCLSEEEAQYWSARGVTAARWAPGLAKKQWRADEFVERWGAPLPTGFGGIAIDEFNGHTDNDTAIAMSEALRRLRDEQPGLPVAVWTINLVPETVQAAALKDAAGVLMVEVYSSHDDAHGRFAGRWAAVERVGVTEKTIFTLWLDRVLTTREAIERQLQHIRRIAPASRGICFNGKAPEHLFAAADELTRQYFVEPVLLVERGEGGLWQCRNIGWMAARDVEVRAEEGAARTRRIAAIEPGEVVDLGLSGDDRLDLTDSDRYTWLMASGDAPATIEPPAAEGTLAAGSGANLLRGPAAAEAQADGAALRLPVDPELTQRPFALTFDIAFEAVGAYGVAAVGLGNRAIDEYTDKFLEYFSGARSPNRIEARFYRGDLEATARSAYRTPGARVRFGYEGADGDFVRATPMMPFEAGKTYRVWIGCDEGWAEVKIANLTDGSEVWRSGRLRIDSHGRFDELYLRVREGAASEITLHADRGEAVLRSGTSPKETDRVVTTATVSNVRMAPLR